MRAPLSRIATLLTVAGMGVGCGGDSGSGTGPPPETSVLTTLEVTPATATLFTVAPGNAVTLSVVAKDQDGQTMSGLGSPSFSSDNGAIASVGDDGTITAVAAGTARITASLTAGGATATGTTTVTARVAPASAAVVAPAIAFLPTTVDVSAGGTVSWTFESIPHDVTFTTAGAPADVPLLQDGSASRTFPNNGSFGYRCSIHPPMTGIVHVH
jgi:plastocyanin